MGTQLTSFENGAILTTGPIQNGFKSSPSFFENNNAIAFRMIEIGGSSAVSGQGTYILGLEMKNSFSREHSFPHVNNLKIQVNSSDELNKDYWLSYLTNAYNFTKTSGSNPWEPYTVYYGFNGKTLVLDGSYIYARVEGMR
jgi:hypothetical protein